MMRMNYLQDSALDLLRATRLKRIPMTIWMQNVHSNTRQFMLRHGLVEYMPASSAIAAPMFAVLIKDPQNHDKEKDRN
jgi:hypothetical protein